MNAAGLAIIKSSEGRSLVAYEDVNGIPTIGYGHTGPDVAPGLTCTQEQADAWLAEDVATADAGVTRECPSATDNQHSALVSLAYNIGLGNFGASTVCRLHNAGNFEGAASAFSLWSKAGSKVLPGLVSRRAAEAALYRTPDDTGATDV